MRMIAKDYIKKYGMERVLNSSRLREVIMDELYIDENDLDAYYKFIDKILSKNRKSNWKEIQDACELAIRLKYYSIKNFDSFFYLITNRLDSFSKLSLLDYCLIFSSKTPKNLYEKFNSALQKDNNVIVKFQAIINMLIYEKTLFREVLDLLKKQKYPTLYYRLINSIKENNKLLKFIDLKSVISQSEENPFFSKNVKLEVKNFLREFQE